MRRPEKPPDDITWMTFPSLESSHAIPTAREKAYRKRSVCGKNPFWNGWILPPEGKPHCTNCERVLAGRKAYWEAKWAREEAKRQEKIAFKLAHKRVKIPKPPKLPDRRLSRYSRGILKILSDYGPLNTQQMSELLRIDTHTILESCYYLRKPNIHRIVIVSGATKGRNSVPAVYRLP